MVLVHRKAAGLTQEALARRMGMSRVQITNIENGRSDTTLGTVKRFADALGCSMRDLMPG